MNDNTENGRNESLARLMSVVGFVVMVCLLAWLAVQIVRFIPTAFSTLASIFDSNQRELRERSREENVVIVGDDDLTDGEDEVIEEEPVIVIEPEEEEDNVIVSDGSGASPAAPAPAPAPVQYKTVVTYQTPVSDPNGYTDLQVAFAAVGRMTAEGRFVPSNSIREGELSALQFTVKNIGTKTSGDWHFTAELPGGGIMNSKAQQPLKPSETSTLTIAFSADGRGNRTAGVTASGGNDINLANNGFRTAVEVVR